MFGSLLGIFQEFLPLGLVGFRSGPSGPSPGDGAHFHLPFFDPDEHLGRSTQDYGLGLVQEEVVGRGIGHPQAPVDIQGITGKVQDFLAREYHLENVPDLDVALGGGHAARIGLSPRKLRHPCGIHRPPKGCRRSGQHQRDEPFQSGLGIPARRILRGMGLQVGIGEDGHLTADVVVDQQIVETFEDGLREPEGVGLHRKFFHGGGAGVAQVPNVAAREPGQAWHLRDPEACEAGLEDFRQGAYQSPLGLPLHLTKNAAIASHEALPGFEAQDAVAGQVATSFHALQQETL